jgi:hypothetical protein
MCKKPEFCKAGRKAAKIDVDLSVAKTLPTLPSFDRSERIYHEITTIHEYIIHVLGTQLTCVPMATTASEVQPDGTRKSPEPSFADVLDSNITATDDFSDDDQSDIENEDILDDILAADMEDWQFPEGIRLAAPSVSVTKYFSINR